MGCRSFTDCLWFVRKSKAEILLETWSTLGASTTLPFTSQEYSIFYRAGDFALSPTYFIDGLSTELWIFIWSFFLVFFLGLLTSVKMYSKYFSHRRISAGDVAMYEMNFVTNQSHVMASSDHENFLSWRIQMICHSVFNIIMACAFSAFILALLSIKTTEDNFNSIEDFSSKRTHMICDFLFSSPSEKFINVHTDRRVKTEFQGIYNGEGCQKILLEKTDQSICEANRTIAFVTSAELFRESGNL